MKQRSRGRWIVGILVLAVFITGFLGLAFSIENASIAALDQSAELSAIRMHETLAQWALDIQRKAEGFDPLSSTGEPMHSFLMLDEYGVSLNDTVQPGLSIDPAALREVGARGYTAANLLGWQGDEPQIALVTSSHQPGIYTAEILPLDEFVGVVRDQLAFTPSAYALFDAEGHPLLTGPESVHAGSPLLDGGPAPQGLSGPLIRSDKRWLYRVYLPLDGPEGWSFGASVSGNTLLGHPPLYRTLLICCLAYSLLFIVYIVLFVRSFVRGNGKELLRKNHDPLTLLQNSSELEKSIKTFFQRHPMKDYSLVYMDIVAFRRYNMMFGDLAGDDLLRAIGKCVRENYHCGTRVHGDLFVFVAKNSTALVSEMARTLRPVVESATAHRQQSIDFKFGIYPLLGETANFRDAYDGALMALKYAKSVFKQRAVIFDLDMLNKSRMKKAVELHMMQALAKKEFLIYIQPKFYSSTTKCCGGEALIRWHSDEMGFLSPGHFIPLFEENGFISELDFYVMEEVLKFQQKCLDSGRKPLVISVNQSRVTISFHNYLQQLKILVSRFSVPLQYIEIEITESAITEDFDMVISLVRILRDMGFSVALDDFGTGYSSLNTLREVPVDVLKIDKEFLRESDQSPKGRKIIQSVINMSNDLDIYTVCEGVETGMQLDFLNHVGCDMVQGYLLSKPMPLADFQSRYI